MVFCLWQISVYRANPKDLPEPLPAMHSRFLQLYGNKYRAKIPEFGFNPHMFESREAMLNLFPFLKGICSNNFVFRKIFLVKVINSIGIYFSRTRGISTSQGPGPKGGRFLSKHGCVIMELFWGGVLKILYFKQGWRCIQVLQRVCCKKSNWNWWKRCGGTWLLEETTSTRWEMSAYGCVCVSCRRRGVMIRERKKLIITATLPFVYLLSSVNEFV